MMPKKSKHPRLRVSVKRGKNGQVWRSWWYDMRGTGQPDVPLGNDYQVALAKWAELAAGGLRITGTIEEAFARWEVEMLPTLKEATRKDYARCLTMLRPVFGPAIWSTVRLPTLKAYLKARSGKTRANRELSVLNLVWNWARLEDMTELHWPAAGMNRSRWKNAEGARDVYVSDEAFAAIYRHADATLRDAMDIASATGLRLTDVLGLRTTDIRAGKIVFVASKTGKRGEFDLSTSTVLPPIIERRRATKVTHLFLLTAGPTKRVTLRMLQDRFTIAREAAAKEVPECEKLYMRDMRKFAAQRAGSLEEASNLLQHSSQAVTRRHYSGTDKMRTVR